MCTSIWFSFWVFLSIDFGVWELGQALTWRISARQTERRLNNHISLLTLQQLAVIGSVSSPFCLKLTACCRYHGCSSILCSFSVTRGHTKNYVVWTAFPIKRTFFYIHIRCISSPRAIIHMTTLGAKRIAESLSPAKKQRRCDFFGTVLAVSARGGNIIPF